MAKKKIAHMDFPALVEINKDIVALTGEKHEYSEADGRKLKELLLEVEARADDQDFEEAIAEKGSLLVFRIASGQYFHAGNKRTALVAAQTFMKKNGRKIDLGNPKLVSAVDKVGIAAATFDELFDLMTELVTKSPTERKGWANAAKQVVESNRRLLTELGS